MSAPCLAHHDEWLTHMGEYVDVRRHLAEHQAAVLKITSPGSSAIERRPQGRFVVGPGSPHGGHAAFANWPGEDAQSIFTCRAACEAGWERVMVQPGEV